MCRYKTIITYDGTRFFGWQKTKSGPTIQESLEKAILALTQEQVTVEAASRTDRGVHAEGQVVAFTTHKPCTMRGLNALLPPDIRVLQLEETTASFHPTLDAKSKEYHYRLCCSDVQDPIHRHHSWHFHYPLNLENMKQTAQTLLGTHDFSRYSTEDPDNPICTLTQLTFSPLPDNRLQIAIRGDRFLYKMARQIVGTLCGKPGFTAPAHGLFLHQVFYDLA